MPSRRLSLRCDTCAQSPRPGLLPLGRDWLECPRGCVEGRIEMIEEQVQPKGRVFIPGDTRGATIFHPEHAKRFS
jgi:hypothetical protein